MKLAQRLIWPLIPVQQALRRRVHDLDYLFLEVTQRCDLSCRHCGSDCSRQPDVPDLPVATALGVLDEIRHRLRPRRLTVAITGGEPLCYPGLEELGAGITRLGFPWGMVTNGWGWDEGTVERVLAAGLRTLTVSLDGLPDTHDWLRGRAGSYERAARTIAWFARSGRLDAMDVVTCVNRRNLPQLPELGRRLDDLGATDWRLFTISPIGRAADEPDLHLGPDEYQRMLRTICELKARARPRASLSESGYLGTAHEFTARDFPFFCRAGVSVAGVMSDGGILACPNIDRGLVQGNVHHESFVDAWEQRFEPFRRRQWLRTGPCATCADWRHGQGGPLHLRRHGQEGPLLCHLDRYELR